jgi:hypothetical protein
MRLYPLGAGLAYAEPCPDGPDRRLAASATSPANSSAARMGNGSMRGPAAGISATAGTCDGSDGAPRMIIMSSS